MKKFLKLIFFLTLSIYLIYPITKVYADYLHSSNFQIDMSNLNMTGGQKTGAGITLNDTVGQSIQGQFDITGYRIRTGFQYINSIIPFSFRISKLEIVLGTLSPYLPATDNNTLTISNGSAYGYAVTAIENSRLQIDATNYIIDTSCDAATPCSRTNADIWSDNDHSFGFGYNMDGDDVDTLDFAGDTYFRPFANASLGHDPVSVMENTAATKSATATVTYKANISGSQTAGNYQNAIQFIATPTF